MGEYSGNQIRTLFITVSVVILATRCTCRRLKTPGRFRGPDDDSEEARATDSVTEHAEDQDPLTINTVSVSLEQTEKEHH